MGPTLATKTSKKIHQHRPLSGCISFDRLEEFVNTDFDLPAFIKKVDDRTAAVGVVGMGYVGLPLGIAFARAGFRVIGYDRDRAKVEAITSARPYISHISSAEMGRIIAGGGSATDDPRTLSGADAILICVPTPLSAHREPDLSFVAGSAEMLASVLRPGQLIVLESTTYPGTTREVVLPILEKTGLRAGSDFLLAYSPEREDPGTQGHSAREIPKVVGGLSNASLKAAEALYRAITPKTVAVSSLEAAEATKLLENVFRCVNIAMINELKQLFTRMGIDVWEVIEAAKSKPFGFMPFYPGPGLGGHCIPIDPFYLSWKAREYDSPVRFIEIAGEINAAMPEYVVGRVFEELNREGKSVNGSVILLVGAAYKKNVDDTRESPSLRLMELLIRHGAGVEYHDPYIPVLPKTRKYEFAMASAPLDAAGVERYDAVLIATDHDNVDYGLLAEHAALIIDTRNVMRDYPMKRGRLVKA
jgi:UDP-N-acetyl-D-glucosamine dehydrogenase